VVRAITVLVLVTVLFVGVSSVAATPAGAQRHEQGRTTSKTTSTSTTFPTVMRQPPQEPVRLGRLVAPTPAVAKALARRYASMMPLLRSGLQVFEAVDGGDKRARVTRITGQQSTPIPAHVAGSTAPAFTLVNVTGTVRDGSGRSWELRVTGGTGSPGGDVDLEGLCGRGRPAPASQGSPGAMNIPCEQIQVEFSKGVLDPHDATVARWTTVKTVTRIQVLRPAP
jgi:hypothetical protein